MSAETRAGGRRAFLRTLLGLGGLTVLDRPLLAAQRALVTGISDGDTVHAILDGQKVRIRLAEIDAPEKKQPFGRRSEESLRELVGGKTVHASWTQVDRYGRLIAHLALEGGIDVSQAQVERGLAWVYRRYSSNQVLIACEARARSARLGLWADSHPIEPWVWRREHAHDQPLG